MKYLLATWQSMHKPSHMMEENVITNMTVHVVPSSTWVLTDINMECLQNVQQMIKKIKYNG
jgi:hypothetical protein